MNAVFIVNAHSVLPSFIPSKNKCFDWRGRCTRFARRLLFDINHQLSTGAESPSKPLRPTFPPQGTSIKQRFLITKRYTSSEFQPLKSKAKGTPAPTTHFFGAAYGDFLRL
jgi:hypothetical protein